MRPKRGLLLAALWWRQARMMTLILLCKTIAEDGYLQTREISFIACSTPSSIKWILISICPSSPSRKTGETFLTRRQSRTTNEGMGSCTTSGS
ncbi:hypothetical protein F5Y10DRAFT_243837, partial [Nemania abortiva]